MSDWKKNYLFFYVSRLSRMEPFSDEELELERLLESVGSPMLGVLKELSVICTDARKPFIDKVNALPTYWQIIFEYIRHCEDFEINEEVFKQAYQYTIAIILNSGWFRVSKAIRGTLKTLFTEGLEYFRERNSILVSNIKGLIKLVDNPWGDNALHRVINEYKTAKKSELEEFFNAENLLLICTRIRILIQSKCEDLALRLLNAIVKFASIPHVSWIDLYIIVMTNSINEIESLRTQGKLEKMRLAEIRLAEIFLLLTEVFVPRIGITRELVLTAFSLNPTKECYDIIKTLHSKTNEINPMFSTVDLGAIPPESGRVMVDYWLYNPFVFDNHVINACNSIGFSTSTTRDLISIITSQRFLKLSWMRGWQELKMECKNYMKHGPIRMRNEDKELKFLNFDFTSSKFT